MEKQIGIKIEAKLNMKKRASSSEQDQVDDADTEYKMKEKTLMICNAKIGLMLDGEWLSTRHILDELNPAQAQVHCENVDQHNFFLRGFITMLDLQRLIFIDS